MIFSKTIGAIALALAVTTAGFVAVEAASSGTPDAQPLAAATYDHMSVNVADYDAALEWYRDKLGFEVAVEWRVEALGGKQLAYLDLGETRIEIVAADNEASRQAPPEDFSEHFNRVGYGHLAFAVNNVDRVLDELRERGVPTFVRGETYPLDGTPFERRVGFIMDPEGNVIEFAEPLRLRAEAE